jgi:peroxiredoxin
MGLNKDKLLFDATDGGDVVASFIKGADGTLISHTTVSGKEALDVNVANTITTTFAPGTQIEITDGTDTLLINGDGSINAVVTATNLDIRDLAFATDKVDVSGSSVTATVSATNLDIRDLAFATDKVDVSGSSVTVAATDLDIRNLDYTLDNVAIKGSTGNQLVVNADGSINANVDVSVTNGSDKLEDAASASGDTGTYVLSVRQDTPASSTSADGDYQSFKTDSKGQLWTASTHQAMSHAAVTVGNTATQIAASALTDRRKILVQNNGNKVVYLGGASVSTSNGIALNSGGSAELELGPGVALYGIASANVDVRFMQLA